MPVETTGAVEVELSGDLIENNTGYLNGTISSGDRSSVTHFAGLTLSLPLEGKIKRTTGIQYPGPGTNFSRYYEIDNQDNSSDLVVDATTETIAEEAGNLIGPYFHYTVNAAGIIGYGSGSVGTTITSSNVIFIKSAATELIISEGVGLKARAFLEGPFNGSAGNMNTSINDSIPYLSPYTEDTRTVFSIPASAVDWVLVQLRDQSDPSVVIGSRAAFLNSDGNLIDDFATSGRGIGIAAPPGDYFISIKHRNHLSVMTSLAQSGLTWGTASTVSTYDFTTGSGQFYGGNLGAKEIIPGIWGTISGDANTDKTIDAVDKNDFWRTQNGTTWGYSKYSDFNLDGNLDAVDKNDFWRPNNGKSSQVPRLGVAASSTKFQKDIQ